jgi:hypothetical protein
VERKSSSAVDADSLLGGTESTVSDFVFIGCVKTKLPGSHAAKDMYQSGLFRGRRKHAESRQVPWFILSAKYGLIHPDDEIDTYELSLASLHSWQRREWSAKVLDQITQRVGEVNGKVIEIHAGLEYREYGLRQGLEKRGAKVVVPLEGLSIGRQLSWYTRGMSQPMEVATDRHVSTQRSASTDSNHVAQALTADFYEGNLDLSSRPNAPPVGWQSMPECVAVDELRRLGAGPHEVRAFLTLVAAMDRARDAERLWKNAVRLYRSDSWVFSIAQVVRRSLFELRDALATSGVSQRHGPDSAAWRLIVEALDAPSSPKSIRRAISEGVGEASDLLQAVTATRSSGQPWFPFLGGPKVSVMWVRMLADPGGASISNLGVLPVAVDVQVRKVTENLGITNTIGRELEAVRDEIQEAWQTLAVNSAGPPALAGTAAALDPALWFFGRWGCTLCERLRERAPISSVCKSCSYLR